MELIPCPHDGSSLLDTRGFRVGEVRIEHRAQVCATCGHMIVHLVVGEIAVAFDYVVHTPEALAAMAKGPAGFAKHDSAPPQLLLEATHADGVHRDDGA